MSDEPQQPTMTFEEWANRLEDRLAKLEEAMDRVLAVLKGNRERELMFFSELAKNDPAMGEYMQEMRDRVMSYPTVDEPSVD